MAVSDPPYRVAVIGLGKIGLPLAVAFAQSGCSVTGVDIDPAAVSRISSALPPASPEEGLSESLEGTIRDGLFRATTDTAAAARVSNTIVIIVPVLLDSRKHPDFSALDAAVGEIGRGLQRGSLVILETTVPVGTTRHRVAEALSQKTGLRCGSDFWVAFSPERVSTGRVFKDLRLYPKVVGGTEAVSTEKALAFYEKALGATTFAVQDAETAEFVKLIETAYRDVNIALANEFALHAARHGIDVYKAIAAANSQPCSHIHVPGVGVGGHCIPIYPHFLLEEWPGLGLLTAARAVNDSMPFRAIDLLERALGTLRGKRVLILGLAYRGNVKEQTLSPTLAMIEALRRRDAEVFLHDPLFSDAEIAGLGVRVADLSQPPAVEAAILQAYHDCYIDFDFGSIPGCQVVLDGRHVIRPEQATAAGMLYLAIGHTIVGDGS